MLDVVKLAHELVDIPSVTGEEGPMAAACAEVARKLSFNVQQDEVAAGRPNLLACMDSPRVLLCSHLDTVPPYIPAREAGDWLYGRGACDTKGIIAAMFATLERLQGRGVRDVGLLLLVGEETDSIGAKRANATLALPSVRYTIVGEPTDSKFARAQKGGLKFTLRVRGKAAHSGYPDEGRSAVLVLLDILQAVRTADWGQDAVLGIGSANIGVLRGGLRANIVPAEAEAEVFVRVVDSVAAVRERITRLVARLAQPLEWTVDTANDPLHLTTIPGLPETVVSFNTDAPHLTHFGERLLMGPGSILVAHGEDERMSKTEMRQAIDLYCRAVEKLRAR